MLVILILTFFLLFLHVSTISITFFRVLNFLIMQPCTRSQIELENQIVIVLSVLKFCILVLHMNMVTTSHVLQDMLSFFLCWFGPMPFSVRGYIFQFILDFLCLNEILKRFRVFFFDFFRFRTRLSIFIRLSIFSLFDFLYLLLLLSFFLLLFLTLLPNIKRIR